MVGSTTFGVPGTEQVVDATFGASRVSVRPNEYNNQGFTGGHYRIAVTTGALTGVAAGGAVFSARWGLANAYMLLKRIQVSAIITTAFTTAQAVDFDVIAARPFSVADSAGTALTPFAGNSQKVRSSMMNTSQIADMRVAAAAALTAGTKTLDANPFGIVTVPNNNTIGSGGSSPVDVFKDDVNAQHPMMFGAGEGFNVRVVTAMGVVGVIKVYFTVEWAEVPGL